MLSNVDITRELGKNIYIYPLEMDNIKGASINLTASSMAWSVKTKDSISNQKVIVIQPHDTGLIETNEIIYVSQKIAGTYHSRVKIASRGLGHIGTTLNPSWVGRSLIALHNHTSEPILIKVGEPIVTVVFEYLNTKSTIKEDNDPSRQDILQGFHLNQYEKDQIYEKDYTKDNKLLKEKMINSKAYKEIKPKINLSILGFIMCSIILIALIILLYKLPHNEIYNIIDKLFVPYVAFYLAIIGFKIKKGR